MMPNEGAMLQMEYLFLFQLMHFEGGSIDHESLVQVLREARKNLADESYIELQGDIRAILEVRRSV